MKQEKRWLRPMLTVLTRGEDRQELVLLACKLERSGMNGPKYGTDECDGFGGEACNRCIELRVS